MKLLGDHHYVSRYIVCREGKSVWDIFCTHSNFITFFNTFSMVLMIDSTYKIIKDMVPLLKIVVVTSTKIFYRLDLCFLNVNKEDNITWGLEMYQNMLKDQNNTPHVILIDHDTSMMNLVARYTLHHRNFCVGII